MPEVYFRVSWPDGREESCYSPSTVVLQHLTAGHSYPLADFLARSRLALTQASERVAAKYGYRCTSAEEQLARLEEAAAAYADRADAQVKVLSLEGAPAR